MEARNIFLLPMTTPQNVGLHHLRHDFRPELILHVTIYAYTSALVLSGPSTFYNMDPKAAEEVMCFCSRNPVTDSTILGKAHLLRVLATSELFKKSSYSGLTSVVRFEETVNTRCNGQIECCSHACVTISSILCSSLISSKPNVTPERKWKYRHLFM